MEPSKSIEISVLPRWDKLATSTTQVDLDEFEQIKGLKFTLRPDINAKIILWQGDIRLIDIDAIVNSTNEAMSDPLGISGSILDAAGPEIREEIAKLDHCRTGEARVTRGFNLPARYVIHTVGPRYNEKYKTAAENALHNCYRSSLEALKEYNLRTIAFPVVQSQKRGYPPEPGCHISIRTVRRFLEHWGHNIEMVIFCVPNTSDFNMYSKVLALYCPRNREELLTSKEELPRDVGNEYGETVIEDRKIRISAFPGGVAEGSLVETPLIPVPVHVVVTGNSSAASYSTESSSRTPRVIHTEALPEKFAFMQGDFDEERKKKFDQMPEEEKTKIQQQQIYANYLYKAQEMDLSDVARLSIIYESGKDLHGRPVVVIVGSRLPTTRPQLDRVFLYMIRVMDKITDNNYVVVYVHTNMEERDTPEFTWIKKVYNIIDSKYGNHLNTFYVIHPTFWLKVFESVLSSVMNNEHFWSKVRYIERLGDIYNNIDHEQLVLPEDVIKFDVKMNGSLPLSSARKTFNSASPTDDL